LECSSDFIWENDANGVMTLFAGRDGESFMPNLGRHGGDAEFPEGAPEGQHDLEAFRRAIERREKFRSLVVPLRGQNGDVRWIRTSGNPLFSADGRFLGYRGAGADITEFRRQRQIDEDRRKAEALGRLASGIAHEINNLLQPIIIYATFGSGDGSAGVGQRRYFARITRAAEAASQIVRNVLSFARQRPPSCEDVPVAEVVRETIDLLGEAQPSGIVPVVRPISGTCIVRADRSGFAQMLTNLVTNAAEAMPHGGTITISAAEADVGPEEANLLGVRPGAYCVLTVADTGPGIPSDQIDKVFDPFFTTKPQGKGTGLGLSVVAGHAKSWGGTATVASTIGAGTTFAIYIPMAERQMLAAQ
jgi:signal transduction histidine kinase